MPGQPKTGLYVEKHGKSKAKNSVTPPAFAIMPPLPDIAMPIKRYFRQRIARISTWLSVDNLSSYRQPELGKVNWVALPMA